MGKENNSAFDSNGWGDMIEKRIEHLESQMNILNNKVFGNLENVTEKKTNHNPINNDFLDECMKNKFMNLSNQIIGRRYQTYPNRDLAQSLERFNDPVEYKLTRDDWLIRNMAETIAYLLWDSSVILSNYRNLIASKDFTDSEQQVKMAYTLCTFLQTIKKTKKFTIYEIQLNKDLNSLYNKIFTSKTDYNDESYLFNRLIIDCMNIDQIIYKLQYYYLTLKQG